MESLEEKIKRVLRDRIEVVPYDPNWPAMFAAERDHLRQCLPVDLIRRIEHFGSTAVPGLPDKPIIDIIVEVRDLQVTRERIAPLLEAQGYDYFWRPTHGNDGPPWYAWFIKRDAQGRRTHHIHMIEAHFEHWDRLLFRDYLIAHPETASQYADLKTQLCRKFLNDRVAYTEGKTAFITQTTNIAKMVYGQPQQPFQP